MSAPAAKAFSEPVRTRQRWLSSDVIGRERGDQLGEHGRVERVQRLRAVERDERHRAALLDQDGFVVGHLLLLVPAEPGRDPARSCPARELDLSSSGSSRLRAFLAPPSRVSQACHSGHQLPSWRVAVSSHCFGRVGHRLVGPIAMLVGGRRVDDAGIVAGAAEQEAGLAAEQFRAVIGRLPGGDMVVLQRDDERRRRPSPARRARSARCR